MRLKVKKSMSILPEGDVKIISFISDFRSIDEKLKTKSLMLYMIPAYNQRKTVHMYEIHWFMAGLQKLQMLVAARESQEKEIR